MAQINDFSIKIATVNGTGSQSANNIILKSIFRMGIPCVGKNLFPSNIYGLPTWFIIRASEKGYMGSSNAINIGLGFNKDSIGKDINEVSSGGFFIYNSDLKFDEVLLRSDITNIAIPCRQLLKEVTDQVKLKKYLTNMLYVGVLAELLNFDKETLLKVINDNFAGKKTTVFEVNSKAIAAGAQFAKNLNIEKKFSLQAGNANQGKLLMDGNSAAGLGMVFGGCSFASWYPITPSSSVCESFENYAIKYRTNKDGKKTFALLQAEDELSAMAMVIGAGWAGARAMTATSGPGVSLMAESVGYSYFAEIPSVIWNVQRMGPSTGLPTRTSQGDIAFMHSLGHGDCKHPILIPGTPKECFEDAQNALNLAEFLQTFVGVASDLDLGMNFSICDKIEYSSEKLNRGKVLQQEDLEELKDWGRYKDIDNDGIPYRTLPNNKSLKAGYFTRGTGHDEYSKYTEDNKNHKRLVQRLHKKYQQARKLVPQPIISKKANADIGLIHYGSSNAIIKELQDLLSDEKSITSSDLRLRALPFSKSVFNFVHNYDKVFVIEQNRDGQILELLLSESPNLYKKLESIRHYDGLPIDALSIFQQIVEKL